MRPFMTEALEVIADRFHPREGIKAIRSLGSGNVNETFLVTHEGQGGAFVMQRLNTNVFDRPDLVMQNLQTLGDHMERRLASPPPQLKGRRWEVPRVVPSRREASPWIEQNGEFWRSITYIGAATTSWKKWYSSSAITRKPASSGGNRIVASGAPTAALFCAPANRKAMRSARWRRSAPPASHAPRLPANRKAATSAPITAQSMPATRDQMPCSTAPENAT